MNGALYPRNVVRKPYVARGTAERELYIGWEVCVRIEELCVMNQKELLFGVTDVDVTEKDDTKRRFNLRRELEGKEEILLRYQGDARDWNSDLNVQRETLIIMCSARTSVKNQLC